MKLTQTSAVRSAALTGMNTSLTSFGSALLPACIVYHIGVLFL